MSKQLGRNRNSLKGLGDYDVRDRLLKELGYPTYKAYLKSDLWKDIKSRVLTFGCMCCICSKKPAKVVHHRKYDKCIMLGTKIGCWLRPLCMGCHRRVEFDGDRKLTLRESWKKYKKLLGIQHLLEQNKGKLGKPGKSVPYPGRYVTRREVLMSRKTHARMEPTRAERKKASQAYPTVAPSTAPPNPGLSL